MKFPKFVEFQTRSFCNANCTICPYESKAKKYGQSKMSDEMINRIIEECKSHKNEIERVIPYLNNEPTLDSRLVDILRRLKANGHFIELSTNLSGLTDARMEAIIEEELVDDLKFSFFGATEATYSSLMPGLKFSKNIDKIKTFCELNKKYGCPINLELIIILVPWLDMRSELDLLRNLFPNVRIHGYGYLDRAGSVNNIRNPTILENIDDKDSYKLAGCKLKRPFERICILANGEVILCSQDWDRSEVVSNIQNETIETIWNSNAFEKIRQKVLGEIETEGDYICKRCKLALLRGADSGYLSEPLKMNFSGDKYLDEFDRKMINVDV